MRNVSPYGRAMSQSIRQTTLLLWTGLVHEWINAFDRSTATGFHYAGVDAAIGVQCTWPLTSSFWN